VTAAAPPRAVADLWRRLAAPTPAPDPFDLALADGLPAPARRWLAHSIRPGTPLRQAVEIEMRGSIRLGAWRRFTARQVLAPGTGLVWAATARVAGLPVTGYDRYSDGTGEMRWRLAGLIPVVTADGPDVDLSAAGRLAGEGVLVPAAFRRASWADGPGPDTATATWNVDGHTDVAELRVGPAGELRSVLMQRWGNPLGEPYGRYPFGVDLSEERTFDGVTIPTVLRAGWFWGTAREADGLFFSARITSATWR
jgi:hypothetical protein